MTTNANATANATALNALNNKIIIKEEEKEKETDVEVYRAITLVEGKYYQTALYTKKTGSWSTKDERYYTTHNLEYVGMFLRTVRWGFGDGAQAFSIFERDGEEVRVDYNYEGTTSFVETMAPSEFLFK